VALPAYQIGQQGAELLIQRVLRQIPNRKHITIKLDPELRIRESTSASLVPSGHHELAV
jgi:DNA-binding LacI/PurR family transcriptional regulator